MRFRSVVLAAFLSLMSAPNVNALLIDANVEGIFTDATFATPVAGATIASNGDFATVALQAGQGILISIDIHNPEEDFLTGIFVSLVSSGGAVEFLGGPADPSILRTCSGFHCRPQLVNIGSAQVKVNSPSLLDPTGELWVQAAAYASVRGTTGAGPAIAAVQLFYVVTGVSGSDELSFDLRLTAGDAIAHPSSTTFNSATLNPVPEPGTAILIGLGLAGLAQPPARRGKRARYGHANPVSTEARTSVPRNPS